MTTPQTVPLMDIAFVLADVDEAKATEFAKEIRKNGRRHIHVERRGDKLVAMNTETATLCSAYKRARHDNVGVIIHGDAPKPNGKHPPMLPDVPSMVPDVSPEEAAKLGAPAKAREAERKAEQPVVSESMKKVVREGLAERRAKVMDIDDVFCEHITIGERLRSFDEQRADELAESMRVFGLQSPIIVYTDPADPTGTGDIHLVAGRHRLAAAIKLGWESIKCRFVYGDDIDRQLIEIVENLHRVDLTKDERDRHIRRYAELLEAQRARDADKPVQSGQVSKGGRGKRSVAGQIAKATGLSLNTVKRATGRITDKKKPPQKKAPKPDCRFCNGTGLVTIQTYHCTGEPSSDTPFKAPCTCDEKMEELKPAAEVQAELKKRTIDGPEEDAGIEDEVDPENYRTAYLLRVDQAIRFASYSGPVTEEIAVAARAVAEAWTKLASEIAQRMAVAA